VELRHHPVLVCDGVRTWPPKWLHTYGPTTASVSGEVGVLESTFLSQVTGDRVYLSITTATGDTYLGSLVFAKGISAEAIFDLLFSQRGQLIASVGSIDLPETFGN
jgi:hypothetical protein